MTTHSGSALWSFPATRLGRWAVGLMVVFVVMFLINGAVFMQLSGSSWWQENMLPFYGILMVLCGMAAGIVGLVAVIRKHERSWLVWITILPLVFMLFLIPDEFLGPPH